MRNKAFLKYIEYPDFGKPEVPTAVGTAELQDRMAACRKRMQADGLSHLLVYGDREHFANLLYVCGFDPRFEEALLILSTAEKNPLLLVGNEGKGHLGASPLYRDGLLRFECYQPFSLMSQPRESFRTLETILAEELEGAGKVGLTGWKTYEADGFENAQFVTDVPSYIADTVRGIAGAEQTVNSTGIFVSPDNGLRSHLSPFEVAYFEYANYMGTEAVKAILKNFRADATDYELMQSAPFTGAPFACHPSIKSLGNLHYSLTSPTGDKIAMGRPASVSISYWGCNICRAGWVAAGPEDMPEKAKDYVEAYVAPYAEGIACWLENLRIGKKGGELWQIIQEKLPFDQFGVYLNPGHLIHFDEWTSSPIYEGSDIRLQSGMYIQSDIIPRSSAYNSSRMEEGFVLADEGLRGQLKTEYPAVYERCMARRQWMESLGWTLPEEILPLSDMAGIIVPFFLDYQNVMTFKG